MDGRCVALFATALLFGLLLLLGALSAFFSAAETALFSLRGPQIERLRSGNPHRAAVLDALLAEPRRLLGALLLADTLANVPLCLLSLHFLHERLPQTSFWWAAVGLFVLVVGLCDLLPKLLALQDPVRVAGPAAVVMERLRPFLDPMAHGLARLGERLAAALTPARLREPLPLTEEEFESIVEAGAESGDLPAAEGEMIAEIIKLGDKTAKDVMTPRVDAFTLPDDLDNATAVDRLRAARHRRAPVYGETPDDILGVLDVRRFLDSITEAGGDPAAVPSYHEILDPPSFVSETMPALDLLRAFLKHAQGLALVVDEYGGVEGVVTFSDIVEEILGDALPRGGKEALYLETLPDGGLLAAGHARLEDVAEHTGFESLAPGAEDIPEGIDTIGGLLATRLGQLPRAGTVVPFPGDLLVTVRQATRRRVGEVLLERRKTGKIMAQFP